jgi:hypothetical protein
MKELTGKGGLVTAGVCTTIDELNRLAKAVFKTASPDLNSVLNQLNDLDRDVRKGDLNSAVARAHDIVDFMLELYQAGALPGTEDVLVEFVNSVYCFAGIDLDIADPANAHVVKPNDEPQLVFAGDAQAAIDFEANTVTEPALIEFVQVPPGQVPVGGHLETKLDQYPGFLMVTQTSQTNAPLAKPAVIGVCAAGVIPQEVRDRLQLGHGKSTGFEIAPSAPADFLDCENATVADLGGTGVFSRIADFLSPRVLQASTTSLMARGGGVGGTVTEFSPFAPVDPVLRSGGGVGGTVTEFTRAPLASLLGEELSPLGLCAQITATEGTPVSPACRPFVQVTTRLGTVLSGVPVTWEVTVGGGRVSDETETECGAFASVIVAPTDLLGKSAICWKLGAVGANQVRATPGVGGDAPAGVSFVPAFRTFDAQATPRFMGQGTNIMIVEGSGQVVPAGSLTPIAPKVLVTDPLGNPVAGARVRWLITVDGTGSVSPTTTFTDASGHASAKWTMGFGSDLLKAYIDKPVLKAVTFTGTGTAP